MTTPTVREALRDAMAEEMRSLLAARLGREPADRVEVFAELRSYAERLAPMVTDTTLSYLSNALGSSALVLIIAYHVRMPPLTPRFSPSRRSAKSTRSRMQACRPKRARPPRTKPLYHTPVLNSQARSLHRSRPPPP